MSTNERIHDCPLVRLSFCPFRWSSTFTAADERCYVSVAVFCSTLVPKANSWLRENANILLVKCETLEKKISSLDQVTADSLVFASKGDFAMYLKGLRWAYCIARVYCLLSHC